MDNVSNFFKNTLGLTGVPDAATLIVNLGEHLPSILVLIGAAAYFLAFVFAYQGIDHLKRAGMTDDPNYTPGKAFVIILLAACLAYLPSTLGSGSESIFGADTGYGFEYVANSSINEKVNASLTVIYKFLYVVGVFAVVHGITILKKVTEGASGREDSHAKGMWHIVGGILAMHLDKVIDLLKSSAGFAG